MNPLVGIAHPYAADPEGNTERLKVICRDVTNAGDIPIAAALYLPQWMDEATERERALAIACHLVSLCRELRVYGLPTEGMQREINAAEAFGIPVVYLEVP